jgi:hypothetical protein
MAAAVLETAKMIKVIPHKTREADINLPSGRICTSRLAGNWATMRPAQKVVVFALSARARSADEEGATNRQGIILPNHAGVFLETHDTGCTKDSLVQSLSEVAQTHARQDSADMSIRERRSVERTLTAS